jgi:hypothetical protein
MGFSKFALYYKSALMLTAKRDIELISVVNFHAFKKEAREKLMRGLKTAASQFIQKDVKDYREVLKNLALGLMKRNG